MIAAITIWALLGRWICTDDYAAGKVVYSFRADQSGSLTLFADTRRPAKRYFRFKLIDEGLVEQFTDPKSPRELHTIQVTRKHLVDTGGVYWHEGRWTPTPMQPTLDCHR